MARNASQRSRSRQQPDLEDTTLQVVEWAWAYRVELCFLLFVTGLWYLGASRVGSLKSGLLLAVGTAAIVLVRPLRSAIRKALHVSQSRRAWSRACQAAGLAVSAGHLPVVRKVTQVPAGDVLSIHLPPGSNPTTVETATETLAAAFGIRDVRVVRDQANASLLDVLLVREDPLSGPESLGWPRVGAGRLSVWDPIPIGVGEDGERITLSLPERNVLLGGEPGAGKSVALSMLVATAALDPCCRLWLLDGKLVELAAWAPCANECVGVSVEDANKVLGRLQGAMDRRYQSLLTTGRRKVQRNDSWPLEIVVCDELAHYLTSGDRRHRQEFAERMRDLVARGRAAGVIVLAATQKPSHDIIPTSLRDLFGFRWALRCSTPQASDTILGAGWASQGFSASSIDAASRGVGYLLHEGGLPVRLKTFFLGDSDLASIASRARELRRRQTTSLSE